MSSNEKLGLACDVENMSRRKFVRSKICPIEKVSVKNMSFENMSVKKTSRCLAHSIQSANNCQIATYLIIGVYGYSKINKFCRIGPWRRWMWEFF